MTITEDTSIKDLSVPEYQLITKTLIEIATDFSRIDSKTFNVPLSQSVLIGAAIELAFGLSRTTKSLGFLHDLKNYLFLAAETIQDNLNFIETPVNLPRELLN